MTDLRPPIRLAGAIAIALTLALAGCGGGGDDGPKPILTSQAQQQEAAATATATPADGATEPSETPTATPTPTGASLTQEQVLGIPTGTPRAQVRGEMGEPLPIDLYALTKRDRRACDFYALERTDGGVSFDNVWRLCFRRGKLFSVSTAPSRAVAAPNAADPSTGKPNDDLTQPRG